MSETIQLLSNFILGDLSPYSKSHRFISVRFIANLGAFFLLAFGYIFGCRALYHYAVPQWGEVYSLLILGAILFITSLLLFFIGWLLKPKEPPLKEFVSNIEKTISEMPNNELIKKVLANIPVKTAAAIFAVIVVATYLTKSNK